MIRSSAILMFVAYAAVAASVGVAQNTPKSTAMHFVDISDKCNIDFVHSDGGTGKRFIMEYVASGLAIFDYDGDGLDDVYFLSGSPSVISATVPSDSAKTNRLYRNLGNWNFQDVTDTTGLKAAAHSLGTVVGDFDNDGDQDIFVNNFGQNQLYNNLGDGTFQEQKDTAITKAHHVGAGACFVDVDSDGFLDLFVANYVDFDRDTHPQRSYRGKRVYPSPQDFAPEPDELFRNNGDGTFTDISRSSGIQDTAGTGMGAIAADFNADGACDIFVCNDVMENFLYVNDGNGNFVEDGLVAGVALDFAGLRQGSMGVDYGDVNGDLQEDIVVTSFQGETPVIYENGGGGFFDDTTPAFGGLSEATPEVTWGVCLADFDNDADLDLFMASGHLMDNIRSTDDTQSYESGDLLYEYDGEGFENVTEFAGDAFQRRRVSRGSAAADFDRDGDLDIIVLNLNAPPSIYRNESQKQGSINLRLIGNDRMNRDALSATVTVKDSQTQQRRTILGGQGYQSSSGRSLHFGVAGEAPVQITVRWPGGTQSTHTAPATGQTNILAPR